MFGMAGIAFLAFLNFANQALFFVWQSAFTHANIPEIRKWFYITCALALMSIVATIAFVLKGFRMPKDKNKKEANSVATNDSEHQKTD